METAITLSILPLEIVILILKQLTGDDGILMLWMVCRHVSKTWRLLVEQIFIVRELPVTSIMLLVPWDSEEYNDDQYDWTDLYSLYQIRIYAYDRLRDDDNKIAVFTMETLECQKRQRYQDDRYKAPSDDDTPTTADRTYPRHVVRSRHFANDTEIPLCHLEGQSRSQLHCDWRLLLTNLLIEEYRIQRKTLANVDKDDLRRGYDPSWFIENNMMSHADTIYEKVYCSLHRIENCCYESQRAERRLRIAAQLNRGNPENWTGETTKEEKFALKRVLRDRAELLYTEFDDGEDALTESRFPVPKGDDDWEDFERGKIYNWWLEDAMNIAERDIKHADKEKEFTRLANEMRQQKLWWREAEVGEASIHLVDKVHL
ncbi:hypothetical protein MMC26_007774 [Xylographa opegraphella]|nr:hypothetical protein [Xylographa opegraphella]